MSCLEDDEIDFLFEPFHGDEEFIEDCDLGLGDDSSLEVLYESGGNPKRFSVEEEKSLARRILKWMKGFFGA